MSGGGGAIHEGWLRKSPPFESSSSLLFRPRWRKRWMVLVQGCHDEVYQLHYYTDETKSKLKGSINLKHCMSISSNFVLETDRKSKQMFSFSLSTPDRVYQFSSENKQLVQTWIEILTNACRTNPYFDCPDTGQRSSSRTDSFPSSTKSSPASQSSFVLNSSPGRKSAKDPYIHLTECYSGNKQLPPPAPPRPAKSSLDIRRKLEFEKGDIQYLDLQFSNTKISDSDEFIRDKDSEEEIIYRNIDFIKTKAFNETRKQVESVKYNIN